MYLPDQGVQILQIRRNLEENRLNINTLRHQFLEYFVNENQYECMKSVSVASRFDPSTDFVYSGACQFARVFTGKESFESDKSSGVQKCVRLNTDDVFSEPFNHDLRKLSFFEMPSFWSKRSDSKKESCELSWNWLTKELKLNPTTLRVSYFSGDDELGFPADEEIRETWLELGIPSDHVLPGDKTSNLWKLRASSGPCGTSTKIYVQTPGSSNMLELWNIGFVKYNLVDDVLKPLPNECVSAGLGLERLTSVLQQTYSCYHIDSFMPLFVSIQKISGAPEYNGESDASDLNAKYRQLADFIRTITVAVADDVFPDTNMKMKRLLRRALYISRTHFKQQCPHPMLMELSARVAETLGEAYPEVCENLNKVQSIIENEEYVLQDVIASKQKWWLTRQESFPFIRSLSSLEMPETVEFSRSIADLIQASPPGELPATKIFRACKRLGIPRSTVDEILAYFDRTVDWKKIETGKKGGTTNKLEAATRLGSVAKRLRDVGIVSDDTPKHEYFRSDDGEYTFPEVRARLLAIIDGEEILSVAPQHDRLAPHAEVCLRDREFGFVCDRTNFCTDRYDLCHEKGYILLDQKCTLKVNRVKKMGDLVIHYATPDCSDQNVKLKTGVEVTLSIDAERRLQLMRSFTLSHLLVIALREIAPVMHVKRSKTSHEYCRHDIGVPAKGVDIDELGELLELKVRDYILKKLPVCTRYCATSFQVLREPNVLYFPNMFYPYRNIKLMEILDENRNVISQEASDAVHVFNTGDIGHVVISSVNYAPRKRFHVIGIAEPAITKSLDLQRRVQSEMKILQDEMHATLTIDQLVRYGEKVYSSSYRMLKDLFYTPHLVTRSTHSNMRKVRDLTSELTSKLSTSPSEILVRALRSRVEELAAVDKFAVYFCTLPIPFFKELSFIVDILYRTDFPTLFLCYSRGRVTGVCHVPEQYVSCSFNAETWMNLSIRGFPNELEIREEADNKIFCYLRGEFVKYYSVIDYIESLTAIGRRVAEEHFVRHRENNETSALQGRS